MSETPASQTERIEVNQFLDKSQLKNDISFSNTDLTSAMMEQASLFVHYGVLAAQAARQVDQFETRLEIAESAVYRQIRDDKVKADEKITEPALKALVAAHKTIRQIKIAINEAKMVETVCKAAVEGFRQRRDMLVQMGALSREELKGEVVITQKRLAGEANQQSQAELKARLQKQMAGQAAA